MDISRIDELRLEHGLSWRKLEEECGLSTGSTTKWKQETYEPKADKLNKVADYFGVNVKWLQGDTDYRNGNNMFDDIDDATDLDELKNNIFRLKRGMTIPVLGEVAAGTPIEMNREYDEYEEISSELAKTGEFYGLKIKGDSMTPRICDGDVVIFRKQNDAESGDIVIVSINGDSATCKRLVKYSDGISLISFNPEYEPINFNSREIQEKPVCIIGKVVENRQKF